MRRITLPVSGRGVDGDALRVNLPTYQFVSQSPDGTYHTVDVPDDDVPAIIAPGQPVDQGRRITLLDIRLLSTAELFAWYAHLDERYQEHVGRFRPKG